MGGYIYDIDSGYFMSEHYHEIRVIYIKYVHFW